ncbi:MAG TPA: DNA polymerase [Nitrososphaerales archaeon]
MLSPYVPGKGPLTPRIVIVGEAPSYEEVQALEPFVGPSGRFLNQLLSEVGIDRNSCWVTNACKYLVPPSPVDKKIPFKIRAQSVGIDLVQQFDELRKELHALQPNVIIALGATALWALTGKSNIQKFRGSILQGMGYKVIPTYHPAHILHQEGEVKGYWNKAIVSLDLKRAARQSLFKEIHLPQRTLQICKNSAQFHDFTQRYKNYKYPSIDIEAMKCIPICVGISFDKREGITIPLWNIWNISDIPDSDLIVMWNMLSEFLSIREIVGQNFGYDRDKIKRLGFIIKKLHSDTMLKAFAINPELPKNLSFLTSIYTEEPYYKDEGMYEGKVEDLLIGCARDACITKEIDEALDSDMDELGTRAYYENFLLPLHELYFFNESDTAIEQVGFRIDENLRKKLIHKYIEWDEKVRYELFKITGEYINTSSPKQVSDLLYEKLHIPPRSGVGEEVLTQLLNGAVKKENQKRAIELILEDRRVKKTLSSYLYSPPDFDGRMRTSYYICLETGRSATQQQEPPIRPSIETTLIEDGKKVKRKIARGMAFQTITKHGDIGADIRTMFIPDDGEVFLQADSSQAEARVIFLLAEDYQALKDIDEHDYHALTASWFFGGTELDYSKKVLGYEHPIRFAGKTLRHAGHLGAGKRRAATEVNTQARKYKIPITISESQAENALRIFHNRQPKIQQVYHNQIRKCLERNRRLVAPVPHGIDAEIGGIRTFFERWNEELFRQAFSYLPQRTVSENTKAAALRIRKRAPWIKILVESHDALLTSVPILRRYDAASILKEEFERPINFERCSLSRGELIIPCDIEEGMNYKDLSKFNFMELVK